ncbi:MAG: FecR family protein [Patescibacteria group bacterium]
MKKIIFILAGAVIAGILGIILYPSGGAETTHGQELAKPWIEIVSPKASAIDAKTGAEIRELKTGDEIENNTTIKTFKEAFVNLYMPDGSVARIDKESVITINEASYQKTDGRLVLSIFIKTGRVWSKILSLATPDSLWEVKTTNAVATVRGTAFGMEYKNGKSRVVGSENKVAVAPIDPATEKVVESAVVVVEPKTFVSIDDDDAKQIKTGKQKFEVKPAPEEFFEESWIETSLEADKEIEEKFEEFREKSENETEVKFEFRDFIQEKFIDEILEQRNDNFVAEDLGSIDKDLEALEKELKTDIDTSEVTTETSPEEPIRTEARRSATPKSLQIIIKIPPGELTEGVKIPIDAVASFSDGSTRSVSGEVKWEIIGGIGRIENGIFVPRLDASVAEFGKGLGSIVATWRDPQTGAEFIANTPIFTVNAAIEQIINTIGQ